MVVIYHAFQILQIWILWDHLFNGFGKNWSLVFRRLTSWCGILVAARRRPLSPSGAQVRFRLTIQIRSRFCPGLVQVWSRFGPGLVQVWSRFGASPDQVCLGPEQVRGPGSGPGMVQIQFMSGPGPIQVWSRSDPCPVPVRFRSGPGPIQVRSRSDPGPRPYRHLIIHSGDNPLMVVADAA